MQRNIRTRPNPRSTGTTTNSIEYYQIPPNKFLIHFVDSMEKLNHLFDRLFQKNPSDEDLYLGFDCTCQYLSKEIFFA